MMCHTQANAILFFLELILFGDHYKSITIKRVSTVWQTVHVIKTNCTCHCINLTEISVWNPTFYPKQFSTSYIFILPYTNINFFYLVKCALFYFVF